MFRKKVFKFSKILPDFRAIPGNTIWWDDTDSSSMTFNGSNVSYLINKTGYRELDLAQASAANQPNFLAGELNGKSNIGYVAGRYFDSVSNVPRNLLVDSDLKSFTTFFLWKEDTNGSSGAHIFEWITAGGLEKFAQAFYNLGNRTLIQCGNNTAGRVISNTRPDDRDTVYYVTKVKRTGNNVEVRWYNNGEQLNFTTTLTDSLNSGNVPVRVDPIGKMGEYVHFNRSLSASEDTMVLADFFNKWGF